MTPPIERLWAHTIFTPGVLPTPCWVSTYAALSQTGYTRVFVNGRLQLCHRFGYEFYREPIPEGLVLDHLCKTPPCWHPWHMEAVTQKVNNLRSDSLTARRFASTHCEAGHPWDEVNTRMYRNKRVCRTCEAFRRGRP